MRTFPLLLFIVCISACSEERQALNRIEGIFETTQFNVTTMNTDSVLFTASPTFQFDECTPRTNSDSDLCAVTIINTDGTVYDYKYRLDVGPSTDYISLRPQDGETWDIDTDLNRSLRNQLVFELDNDELKMYTEEDRVSRGDSIQGYRDYDVSITAVKR